MIQPLPAALDWTACSALFKKVFGIALHCSNFTALIINPKSISLPSFYSLLDWFHLFMIFISTISLVIVDSLIIVDNLLLTDKSTITIGDCIYILTENLLNMWITLIMFYKQRPDKETSWQMSSFDSCCLTVAYFLLKI